MRGKCWRALQVEDESDAADESDYVICGVREVKHGDNEHEPGGGKATGAPTLLFQDFGGEEEKEWTSKYSERI